MSFWASVTSGFLGGALNAACVHNGRGETTSTDIAEHVGNGEFGSAARDLVETPGAQAVAETVVEATVTVLDAIGNEALSHKD